MVALAQHINVQPVFGTDVAALELERLCFFAQEYGLLYFDLDVQQLRYAPGDGALGFVHVHFHGQVGRQSQFGQADGGLVVVTGDDVP